MYNRFFPVTNEGKFSSQAAVPPSPPCFTHTHTHTHTLSLSLSLSLSVQIEALKRQVDELEQHNTDVIDEADTELINLQKQNALLKTELVRVKSKQVRPGTSKALSSPCLSSPTFAPPPTC